MTNALNIALILGENPGITLIVTGGEFKAPTLSLTGKMAADSLKGFHANKLFLATAGISPDMSDLSKPQRPMVKSAMIKAAEEVILVADSSKIGISAFASLGSITMVNSFITDNHISKENIEKMKGKNINLPDWIIEREKETRPSYPFILYYKYKYNLPAFPCLFISLTERTGFSRGTESLFTRGTECHSVLESLHPLRRYRGRRYSKPPTP
ncbi:hypothetical protein NIB75_01185 [Bacteroides uniformis]|nr:hypothetical protein [Bacteroides uniformis]